MCRRALQGTVLGPYNYQIAFDTTIITNDPLAGDGPTNFKAVVCNGVGMCVDTNILEERRSGQHGAGRRQHVAAQLSDHRDQGAGATTPAYCAKFSPNDPPLDLTNPVTTEFEYRVVPGGTWLPAGRYNADPTKDTNGGCTSTQGRLPPDLPGNAVPQSWPDGTVIEVRGRATDAVGRSHTSAWLTHYQIKVDNQFPDAIETITLNPGWNLISLPLPPAQPAITPA